MTPLSDHFSLEELTFSRQASVAGISNQPNVEQIANLTRLCHVLLEPARAILGAPFHVNSGFRSPIVNQLVFGAANSAHLDGRAADIVPVGVPLQNAFDTLRRTLGVYDQLIIECNAWIHIAVAPLNTTPRQMAMTATGMPGHWQYELVA